MELKEFEYIFKEKVTELDNTLNDWREGSVLSTVGRAVAYSNYQSYLKLLDIEKNSLLITATGDALDAIGKGFNISRLKGVKAHGYALVTSYGSTPNLGVNTVFTELVTGKQFLTTEALNLNGFGLVERRVPIQAVEKGSSYNLPTGTPLAAMQYPDLVITVGSHRTPKGELCGSIQGGAGNESDEAFRQRIIDTLLYSRYSSSTSLENALLADSLLDSVVVETTAPGFCTVWVDSGLELTDTAIKGYTDIVSDRMPGGILFEVKQLKRLSVEISLKVKHTPGINLDRLGAKVKQAVNSYLQSLKLNQAVDFSQVIPELVSTSFKSEITSVQVLLPLQPITPQEGEIIRLDNLVMSYSI